MLTSTYHQTYDLLLLALPWLAAATSRLGPATTATPWLRWVVLIALSVPAVNYLVDGWTLGKLHLTGVWWLAVTSVNGLALLVALFASWALALRARGDREVANPNASKIGVVA